MPKKIIYFIYIDIINKNISIELSFIYILCQYDKIKTPFHFLYIQLIFI